jgi:metal-responsive CopG/Arc/MetJ family transcriptional regulator
MTTRALFSLSDETMATFRELVPSRERSAVVEALLRKELASRSALRERELERIVHMVETDEAFTDVRQAEEDVAGIAGETLYLATGGKGR